MTQATPPKQSGPDQVAFGCGPDVVIDEGAFVGQGVQLWGKVRLLAGTSVGVGAIVVGPNGGDPIQIGPKATLGAGAVVSVAGVGANAIIEPGAVVTQSVPSGAVVGGNPARVLRMRTAAAGSSAVHRPQELSEQAATRKERLIHLTFVDDMRGSLVAAEVPGTLPFTPKRFFSVFDVPGPEVRGEHAHRVCGQLLVAVNGSIEVICDDGSGPMTYLLDRPDRALYIPPMVWGVQHKYSAGAVLVVFASHPYDDGDYIRSFEEFRDLLVPE